MSNSASAQESDGRGPDVSEGSESPLEMPVLTNFVEAVYPKKAEAEGIEAVVVLEVDIDVEGNVEQARVIKLAEPTGYGFDEAARIAVEQFVFEPALADGEPVPVRVTYTYGFKLEEKPVPVPVLPKGSDAPKVVNLTGLLLERGTRDPLIGVTVVVYKNGSDAVEPVGFEVETGSEGRFEFAGLEVGEWSIIIQPSGYLDFETKESVVAGEVTEVIYFAERARGNPYDIMVQGDRPKKEVTRRTLATSEIERIPGTFGDPVKVVTNLPGVGRAAFGSGEIIVRGSETNDSEAYVEGAPILSVYHFGGLRSVIPAGMLENVDFYPGNFSVRYGQKMGGVLDVRLKELRPEAVHGYVDVNLFDAGVYIETPVGEDVAVAVAARRSYIDAVLDAVIDDDAPINIVSAPRYYDGQLLVSWRPTPSHKLRLFAFGTDDTFELTAKSAKDVDTRTESGEFSTRQKFAMISLFDEYTPTTRLTNKIQVGTSLFKGDDEFFGLYSRASLSETFLREELSYKFNKKFTVNVGADARTGKGKLNLLIGDLPQEGEPGEEPPVENLVEVDEEKWFTSAGVFVETELRPVDGLLVTPGVRVDVQRWTQELTVDPRLTTRYDLLSSVTVKGGAGVFHQPPAIEEILDNWGNPDLKSEWAAHYSAGFEWTPLDHLTLDVTGFYKDMNSLVSRTDKVVERDGQIEPLLFDNSGRGRVYGMELMLRHDFSNNFFGWVSYTLSRSERWNPETNSYRLFDYDQTHVLTAVGSYQLPWNMELGLRWRLVSGNPETPVSGAALDSDLDQYIPLYGAVNSSRAPLFHQLDMRLDKRWLFDTWMLNTYVDIQNVYNRSNVEGYQYNYDYSKRAIVQGLPIFPALGVKAEF